MLLLLPLRQQQLLPLLHQLLPLPFQIPPHVVLYRVRVQRMSELAISVFSTSCIEFIYIHGWNQIDGPSAQQVPRAR